MACQHIAPAPPCPVFRPARRMAPGNARLPAAIALPLAGLLSREVRRADDLATLDRALRAHGYCLRVGDAGIELHSWPTGGMICRLEGLPRPAVVLPPTRDQVPGRAFPTGPPA